MKHFSLKIMNIGVKIILVRKCTFAMSVFRSSLKLISLKNIMKFEKEGIGFYNLSYSVEINDYCLVSIKNSSYVLNNFKLILYFDFLQLTTPFLRYQHYKKNSTFSSKILLYKIDGSSMLKYLNLKHLKFLF